MLKKIRRAIKALKTGKFIMRLVDVTELVERDDIADIVEDVKAAVKGKRLKVTKENVSAFSFVLGVATDLGIIALAELIKEALKDDMADIDAIEDTEYPPAAA